MQWHTDMTCVGVDIACPTHIRISRVIVCTITLEVEPVGNVYPSAKPLPTLFLRLMTLQS